MGRSLVRCRKAELFPASSNFKAFFHSPRTGYVCLWETPLKQKVRACVTDLHAVCDSRARQPAVGALTTPKPGPPHSWRAGVACSCRSTKSSALLTWILCMPEVMQGPAPAACVAGDRAAMQGRGDSWHGGAVPQHTLGRRKRQSQLAPVWVDTGTCGKPGWRDGCNPAGVCLRAAPWAACGRCRAG